MIVLAGAILGALFGGLRAKRRKGRMADILLWGAVFAMIFALAGLIITLIVHRIAV